MLLSEQDQLKEQIRFNTEIIKLFVVALLATIGGIITSLLGGVDTGVEYVFLIWGKIIAVVLIAVIYNLYKVTQKHIRNGRIK